MLRSALRWTAAPSLPVPITLRSTGSFRTLTSVSMAELAANKGAVSTSATTIGWIGTGVMGKSMVGHLLNKGYKCVVYTRTMAKAEPLRELGADLAESPAAVAEKADVIFSIVGYPKDVEEIAFGSQGFMTTIRPHSVFVDMTTSSPELAERIDGALRDKQCYGIDAPVSGGDIGAREARLSIMCGGDRAAFDYVSPLFEPMGRAVYIGEAGCGQKTKLTNQILISATMISLCEGLLYAQRAGLPIDTVLAAVSKGAAGSKSLDLYANRILSRDFEPGFFTDHFVKDMGMALDEAKRMNLNLPGLELAMKLYRRVQELGKGDKGTQALMLAIEDLNKETQP